MKPPREQLLVLNHLVHSGCEGAAVAFFKAALEPFAAFSECAIPVTEESIRCSLDRSKRRKELANLLLSNSSELLLERLRFEYPAFLEDNQEVFHVIRVRLFVELLLKLSAGDINIFPKVYNVGQQLEAKEHAYGRTVEKITQDALAMIAYRDPHESPSAYLLSETSRQEAAGVLEDALLKHDGLSECTPLERLLKAFITDVEYLKESGSIEVALTESVPSLVLKDAIKQD